MPTIHDEILNDFLKKLGDNPNVDPKFLAELRSSVKSTGRLKADELVAKYVDATKQGAS